MTRTVSPTTIAVAHGLDGRDSMAGTAKKSDPAKWEKAKQDARAKMGGKHSARAMQLAVKLYKDRGGKYEGAKKGPSENKLSKWSKQDWGYAGKKKKSVYLPKAKRSRLKSTPEGRKALAAAAKKKLAATKKGEQYAKHGLAKGTS